MPMWSEPRRVSEQMLNSYKLETLEGQPLEGEYHTRRLRSFTLREGTELAVQQKEVEERWKNGREPEEETEVGEEPEPEKEDNEETSQ